MEIWFYLQTFEWMNEFNMWVFEHGSATKHHNSFSATSDQLSNDSNTPWRRLKPGVWQSGRTWAWEMKTIRSVWILEQTWIFLEITMIPPVNDAHKKIYVIIDGLLNKGRHVRLNELVVLH